MVVTSISASVNHRPMGEDSIFGIDPIKFSASQSRNFGQTTRNMSAALFVIALSISPLDRRRRRRCIQAALGLCNAICSCCYPAHSEILRYSSGSARVLLYANLVPHAVLEAMGGARLRWLTELDALNVKLNGALWLQVQETAESSNALTYVVECDDLTVPLNDLHREFRIVAVRTCRHSQGGARTGLLDSRPATFGLTLGLVASVVLVMQTTISLIKPRGPAESLAFEPSRLLMHSPSGTEGRHLDRHQR